MKKRKSGVTSLDFKTAFKYPFNRAKAMWNILWIFLPIFGWFALGGYTVRIIQEFSKGKFKKLPVFKFKSDIKLGFFMFLKALPFIIAYLILTSLLKLPHIWVGDFVNILLEIFIVPILTIHFINKQTVSSFFEFKILKSVFNNLGDYIIAVLKSILLCLVFIVMSIILVGIPALFFTENMFLADFYRRKVK